MAMRTLFRLRALVNLLLKNGKIDKTTIVNIEFARALNDANMRNAIERYQRDSFWANTGLYEYVQIFVISNGRFVSPST